MVPRGQTLNIFGYVKRSGKRALWTLVMASPRARRVVWRVARSLYCVARGEQQVDDMRVDGEFQVQEAVLRANRTAMPLVAIDVGANRGDWTRHFIGRIESELGRAESTEVHVFEPVPDTFELLSTRVGLPSLRRASLNSMAVSDKHGLATLAVMSKVGGTNSLVYDDEMVARAQSIKQVPMTTLDRYCDESGISHVHLIKCDTEGHDLAVIRGSEGLLRSGRVDVFQFEYNHRWILARAYLKDVFSIVDGLPFSVGRVMPDGVEIFDRWHPELERYYQSNYVLLRYPALSWFKLRRGRFDSANSYA